MKWPLDQILPGPNFTLLSLKAPPAFGSDHHPYFAELCLDPAASARQSPPAVHQEDVAIAVREFVRGPRKAKQVGYKGKLGAEGEND